MFIRFENFESYNNYIQPILEEIKLPLLVVRQPIPESVFSVLYYENNIIYCVLESNDSNLSTYQDKINQFNSVLEVEEIIIDKSTSTITMK